MKKGSKPSPFRRWRWAEYFAAHDWEDITAAFPVNLREIDTINRLAARVRLGLLVENPEAVRFLQEHLAAPLNMWIKVNMGANRTGLAWDKPFPIIPMAQATVRQPPKPFQRPAHPCRIHLHRPRSSSHAAGLSRIQPAHERIAPGLVGGRFSKLPGLGGRYPRLRAVARPGRCG
jgi:hypothetical protein